MSPPLSGVLIVDKPIGPTSHDVVSWARRVFATRAVGHAGTLDPAATGVLVVLVEEATKLSTWLTSEQKEYLATVRFHVETDTLDADGTITQTLSSPPALTEELLLNTLEQMLGEQSQIPPQVSAIKMQGVAAHERVRRGEELVMAPRVVNLIAAKLLSFDSEKCQCQVQLRCSKGYYVRAFARDFAGKMGTIAHLTQLRRTLSGVFSVDQAVDGELLRRAAREDASLRDSVRAQLRSIDSLATVLPSITVTAAEALALRQGKHVAVDPSLTHEVVLVLEEGSAPVGLAQRIVQNGEVQPKLGSVRNFAYEPLKKAVPSEALTTSPTTSTTTSIEEVE